DDPAASRPALEAAAFAHQAIQQSSLSTTPPWVTISGGINTDTGAYLRESRHDFIAGVGMGTMARKAVWPLLTTSSGYLDERQAVQVATQIVQLFKNKEKSGIIPTGASQSRG